MNRLALITVPLLALAVSGCITRQVNQEVYNADGVTVDLRGDKKGTEWVSRDYEQPAIISPLRVARILAAIEVEIGDGNDRQRTGIMSYPMYQPVSRAMSDALAEANPGQMLAVVVVLKQRRLGLFHKKYLTSFLAYVKDGELSIHLSRVNWEVPKGKEKRLPTPRINDDVMDFRVVPVRGMRRQGPQAIAARWRDPAFGNATALRPPTAEDGVRRRTILMDERLPVGERDGQLDPTELEGLSDDQIRALEKLQDQRENGEITEDEYLRARDDLLLDSF